MSALLFEALHGRACVGLKGPNAAEWLLTRGVVLPMSPNSWTHASAPGDSDELLVARLGTAEFFLENATASPVLNDLKAVLAACPPGVYPVLREDSAFRLSGKGVHEALAQVCNVHFAGLALEPRPVIMTLMIGVAVLVVPQGTDIERRYRMWCDPTFAPSLSENLAVVVADCGGTIRELSA